MAAAARSRHHRRTTAAAGEARAPGQSGRLVRLSHIFAAAVREELEMRLLAEITALSLTPSQFHLLKLMTYNGVHQVGEVASFLGVSAPAASKNIDKLERLGLVSRSQSEGDRRATLLAVSARGRRLVSRYEEAKAARLAPILAAFAPADIEHFSGLLERFAVELLRRGEDGDGTCLRCAAYVEAGCPVAPIRGGCPYERLRALHPPSEEES